MDTPATLPSLSECRPEPATDAPPNCAVSTGSDILRFDEREIREAIAYSLAGGQSLHLMSGRYAYLRADTPSCFKGRTQIAHLFDQNAARLIATAKKLGVRVIKVERLSTPRQHIDLCGKPLSRALAMAYCPNNVSATSR
jgi:hypothetical protein